jgi:hypothetical protein
MGKNMSRRRFAIAALLLLLPTRAFALFSELTDYLKQYEVGIDYENSYDSVDASYLTSKPGAGVTKGCVDAPAYQGKERCTVAMTGGSSSGFGLFLQQAFKRQGNFYFNADIGFGVRYLNGEASSADLAQAKANNLPLKQLSFSLAALVIKPYLTVGITPASKYPDLLLSFGPAAQLAVGKVSVDGQTQDVGMATSSETLNAFFQLEVVLWRFGKGALSLFHAADLSGDGAGTKFYPKSIDGMDDIRADFDRKVDGGVFGLGVKLLLNWP